MKAVIALLALLLWTPTALSQTVPHHGIAMHGSPALTAKFEAFPHVRRDAPKGGRLTLGSLGSFDSLNPLVIRGTPAEGIRDYTQATLLARAPDEPFTLYGLIADSVETPPDRAWVQFRIDRRARFSDGRPITPDDVLFSFELLREKGRPNHRTYYSKVARAERIGEDSVRFTFAGEGDRELPLIMGLMPVLAKHATNVVTFEQTTLEPGPVSGPYTVGEVDAGKTIVYKRIQDWWARDLPVNRGRYNFDEIRFEYFRDANTLFQAFRTGAVDFRLEDDPGRWANGYKLAAVENGEMVRTAIESGRPSGMMALVFNMRRPLFSHPDVRRALIEAFDFEWINRNLYYDLYRRTRSLFDGSELSSAGREADAAEMKLLRPFAGQLSDRALKGAHILPSTGGTEGRRDVLKRALELLSGAGYEIRDGQLIARQSGQPFAFEILAASKAQERLMLAYARNLKRLGIDARIRLVDSAEYESRKKSFDFDMIQNTWTSSFSPGNEQLFRWSSKAAETPGTFNYAGVRNPAVDATISAMLAADSHADFVSSVRAFDRTIMAGDYFVPLFHVPTQWIAHWNSIAGPQKQTLYDFDLTSWWRARPGK